MKPKILGIVFLAVVFLAMVFLYGINHLSAQQPKYPPKLESIGVITPDGKKEVFLMGPQTAQELKGKWGVVMMDAGVPFLKAKSWKMVAHAAKSSADDLTRTVADLVARVDALEKRVDDLEKKS